MAADLPTPLSAEQAQLRRKGAARTALVVGGIALAVYLAFILSGVVGR